jgi:hypothetical protein
MYNTLTNKTDKFGLPWFRVNLVTVVYECDRKSPGYIKGEIIVIIRFDAAKLISLFIS